MELNKEIITFKLAKIAKEKGFNNDTNDYYDINHILKKRYELFKDNVNIDGYKHNSYIPAPTYYRLIDWIFSQLPNPNLPDYDITQRISDASWLETWYILLKDTEGSDSFIRKLFRWFRVNTTSSDLKLLCSGLCIYHTRHIDDNEDRFIETMSYEEAEHDGIQKIFKIIKNEQ